VYKLLGIRIAVYLNIGSNYTSMIIVCHMIYVKFNHMIGLLMYACDSSLNMKIDMGIEVYVCICMYICIYMCVYTCA